MIGSARRNTETSTSVSTRSSRTGSISRTTSWFMAITMSQRNYYLPLLCTDQGLRLITREYQPIILCCKPVEMKFVCLFRLELAKYIAEITESGSNREVWKVVWCFSRSTVTLDRPIKTYYGYRAHDYPNSIVQRRLARFAASR